MSNKIWGLLIKVILELQEKKLFILPNTLAISNSDLKLLYVNLYIMLFLVQ